MSKKYCEKKRQFLIQASAQLGLIPALNLFSFKSFSQSNSPKKNVIFIFFSHGANIPFGNKENKFYRGGFHFGSGSQISNMKSIAGDALFVRGVNNYLDGNSNTNHPNQQYSALTASRSRTGQGSADIIAGRALQKRYKSVVPYLTLGFNMHIGGDNPANPPWVWKTVSFDKNRPVFPQISVNSAYLKMINGLSCANKSVKNSGGTSNSTASSQYLKNLQAVQENLKNYKSQYLVSKTQMEKLEAEVAQKLETRTNLNQPINCANLKNPSKLYQYKDNIQPNGRLNVRLESAQNFHNKSEAFFDLMIQAFKTNYTRSITYTTNLWNNRHHGNGGHEPVNNPDIRQHLAELSRTLNTLFVKLKAAGIYDETLVVLTGEFSHQHDGSRFTHRGDNMPYIIVNGGKSGEINRQRPLHAGDVLCNVLNRLNVPTNSFGTRHTQLKRVGNFSDKFFT